MNLKDFSQKLLILSRATNVKNTVESRSNILLIQTRTELEIKVDPGISEGVRTKLTSDICEIK